MLNEILPSLKEQVNAWAIELRKQRWITKKDHQHLISVDEKSPQGLFSDEERPLVVGFFGGTGVGKSSILNRLANENIARTGVQRPTSMEVTVYLHQSMSIDKLPADLPTDTVKIVLHKNEENRELLWVDMPDFDSVEQANKDLVFAWLPYIDVLVYVVSPERYRDDAGWRLLLEHGQNHAWLFIMNHWDRGDEVQHEDFTEMLVEAGLQEPVILRTDCNPNRNEAVPDDFDDLVSNIQTLANENIITHLQQRGIHLKIQELHKRTKQIITQIGSSSSINLLNEKWNEIWSISQKDIIETQSFLIQDVAEKYATKETRWFTDVVKTIRGHELDDTHQLKKPIVDASELWDDQVQTIVQNSLDQLQQHAKLLNLSVAPVSLSLKPLRNSHKTIFALQLQSSLHEALSEPGSYFKRLAHRLSGIATTILPFLALAWVAQRIVLGFFVGVVNEQGYLGFDFAIHGLLLVGIAWILPYFLYQKLKPSLRESVKQGMVSATAKTLEEFDERVVEALVNLKRRQRQAVAKSERLFSIKSLPHYYSESGSKIILERMLMKLDD